MSTSVDFNHGWRFQLGDDSTAMQPDFDDASWRELQLPHDWSVEHSFAENLEGATGYLPGGIGWYRKHFNCENGDDTLTEILFDGIYNNASIWINGHNLGDHPYGYSPIHFELTHYLNPTGTENVIAVRVDHSSYADSRWYTGSGIYRNVKLIQRRALQIPAWGICVTTPEVSEKFATIAIETVVANFCEFDCDCILRSRIVDATGHEVAQSVKGLSLETDEFSVQMQPITLRAPQLWSPQQAALYRIVSELEFEGVVIQRETTRIGIRSIRFDADEGFFLNGVNTLIKGVCLHHDAGLVGAAVPDGVWRRRLAKLRECGCNAIRSAHNPASAAFLDLCDEMGFLVQNEFFDEWDYPKDKRLNMKEQSEDELTRGYTEHFQQWAEKDLKAVILRDRNHPSIIQWSIGNEIEWTYPSQGEATGYFNASWDGNYFWSLPPYSPAEIKERMFSQPQEAHTIGETAQKLSKWTKELDTTRPVVANCILPSASMVSGYADALDVVGFSYGQVHYTSTHAHFPDKVIMGTENLGQWHEWQHVIERPFICGTFLWTGIDYLGEAHGKWPQKTLGTGLLDLAGFEKPSFHMMKTLWNDEPHIHIVSQTLEDSIWKLDADGQPVDKEADAWKQRLWIWHEVNEHWNYDTEKLIIVEVYSNCDSVELFLNERSLGRQQLADFPDRIYKWAVPFEPGTLTARGTGVGHQPNGDRAFRPMRSAPRRDVSAPLSNKPTTLAIAPDDADGEVIEKFLHTAGTPTHILLTADATSLTADGYEVTHLVAQLVDSEGHSVKTQESEIEFHLNGTYTTLGIDNGHDSSTADYQSTRCKSHQGRCMLLLQSKRDEAGTVRVRAQTSDLSSEEIQIEITPQTTS